MTRAYSYIMTHDAPQGVLAGKLGKTIDATDGIKVSLSSGEGRVTTNTTTDLLIIHFLADLPVEERAILDGSTHEEVLATQEDDGLDPGASPAVGDRYIISDMNHTHANFNPLPGGMADDDIIEWDGDEWILAVDVSAVDNVKVFDVDEGRFRLWESGTGSWVLSAAGGLIAAHDPTPIDKAKKVTLDGSDKVIGAPIIATAPRPATTQYIDVTHNWADKTTWYTMAAQKVGEALTQHAAPVVDVHGGQYRLDDGGGSPVPFWIDANHRKLYREYVRHQDKIARIYDDGSEVVVAKFGEDKDSDGVDCEIDYVTGIVTFDKNYSVTGPITGDFYHVDPSLGGAEQSIYIMKPPVGYKVLLERVEVQFTKGIDVKDDTVFTAFIPLNYLAIQTDANLDPTLFDSKKEGKLREGMSFLITDKDNLHANFGTIPGLENGDIVYYRTMRENQLPDGFVVWFDASEESSGSAMNVVAGTDPFPTVSTWNGSSWSVEGYGAPTNYELPEARDLYSSFRSFLDDATGNYPEIPAGFSTGDRGCAHGIMQIPFNWLGSKILDSSLGLELRVWLSSGKEFGPDRTHFSTASFYGQIHNGG